MKTLSKKAKYGLRALYALTRKYRQGPVLISDLAQHEAIPKKFLEIILLELRNRGIVASRKGKGGGYFLSQPPDKITVGSIVRFIDGPLAPLPCASETAYRRCEECVHEASCETRLMMKKVRDATAAILDGTTLADICEQADSLREEKAEDEALMFYI